MSCSIIPLNLHVCSPHFLPLSFLTPSPTHTTPPSLLFFLCRYKWKAGNKTTFKSQIQIYEELEQNQSTNWSNIPEFLFYKELEETSLKIDLKLLQTFPIFYLYEELEENQFNKLISTFFKHSQIFIIFFMKSWKKTSLINWCQPSSSLQVCHPPSSLFHFFLSQINSICFWKDIKLSFL